MVRISAKTDYAVRAAAVLAAQEDAGWLKTEVVARGQQIPVPFLLNILGELRTAGIVQSRRGAEGGYRLARPASEITVADVIRAIDGPLANVAGERPEDLEYLGAAGSLREVWVAVRAQLRAVLEVTTLADVAADRLPEPVLRALAGEDVWRARL